MSMVPEERVGVDTVGTLPTTTAGNRFVAVMIGCFMKWFEFAPTPNQEASTVAAVFVDE